MFYYDTTLTSEVCIDRPDPKVYFLLDSQMHGTRDGLKQAGIYIKQAFMTHNRMFYENFMRLAARQINDMEILAKLLHLEHGEDDRYYDESNDDTPVFEYILSSKEKAEIVDEKSSTQQHVNNDLSAAIMRDMEYEEGRIKLYQSLRQNIDDEGVKKVFAYLIDSAGKAFQVLKNTLHILTTHTELKEFGEGDTHESWDLDTSNYFDKPNPYFLTPNSEKK